MGFEYKFFALNKKSDWENGLKSNLQITEDGISIGQRDQFLIEQSISQDDLVTVSGVLDIAAGQHNLIYILDEKFNLWIYDYKNSRMEQQYKNNETLFTRTAKILVYQDVLYIMDPSQLQKLYAVSLVNGQILWTVKDIAGIDFYPLDFALDHQGNLYILSHEAGSKAEGTGTIQGIGNLVIVRVSQSGNVSRIINTNKQPALDSADMKSLKPQYFINTAPDGSIYLLDGFLKTVTGFDQSGEYKLQFEIGSLENPYEIGIDDKGNVFIGDAVGSKVSEQGEFVIYSFGASGEEIGVISGYRGRSFSFIPDKRNRIFVYNKDEAAITILKRKLIFDESGISGMPKGIFISSSFDCTESETVWHKIELNLTLPKDTQIMVSYIASDIRDFSINGGKKDLDNFIRNDKLSIEEKVSSLEHLWSKPIVNPQDALVFNAKGRYFWIRIELFGSGQASPLLKSMKIVYPRMSYLRYLPAVYQEDEASRDFLERFLSLFETFFSDMEDKIENVVQYLDADYVSDEFLKWLSGWLGIHVDESWSESKLRVLVKKANEIYKQKGTRQGIEKLIEIYTGEKPLIIEHFQWKGVEDSSEVRDLFEKLYGNDPYRFYVLFKPNQIKSDEERAAVRQILDSQTPAYTEAVIMHLQPWVYLDMYTYLGVNTFLSEPTVLMLDNRARLPHNTIIIDTDNNTRMEGHSRLDVGINLR